MAMDGKGHSSPDDDLDLFAADPWGIGAPSLRPTLTDFATPITPSEEAKRLITTTLALTAFIPLDRKINLKQISELDTIKPTTPIKPTCPPSPWSNLRYLNYTLSLNMSRNAINCATIFYLFPKIQKFLQTELDYSTVSAKFIAGLATGGIQTALTYPLSTLWTLANATAEGKTTGISMSELKKNSLHSYYNGASSTLARNVIYLSVYPTIVTLIQTINPDHEIYPVLLNALAGMIATFISYPFDTLSKIAQVRHQSTSSVLKDSTIITPRRLLHGLPLCLTRMGLTSIMFMDAHQDPKKTPELR